MSESNTITSPFESTTQPIQIPLDKQSISIYLEPPNESTKPEIRVELNQNNISSSLVPPSQTISPNTQTTEQIPTIDGVPHETLNNPTFDPLIAISKWPYYVLPFPIDQLPTDIQEAIQAVQHRIQNHLNNNMNNLTKGSGQQQSSSGNQQSQPPSSSQGQGQGQGQGQPDPSSQGMVGYIPIVFFPCNGGQGQNQGQYAMGMPYPYQQQQQPSQQSQQQQQQPSQQNACGQCQGSPRSHPLFNAISSARFFPNSDSSITQVFPRPVRSRRAKIDRKNVSPPAAHD